MNRNTNVVWILVTNGTLLKCARYVQRAKVKLDILVYRGARKVFNDCGRYGARWSSQRALDLSDIAYLYEVKPHLGSYPEICFHMPHDIDEFAIRPLITSTIIKPKTTIPTKSSLRHTHIGETKKRKSYDQSYHASIHDRASNRIWAFCMSFTNSKNILQLHGNSDLPRLEEFWRRSADGYK